MPRSRAGTTLLEVTLALLLAALLLGLSWPVARSARDRWAVRAARDAVAGALARTRATAIAVGSASLTLDLVTGRVRVDAPGDAAPAAIDVAAEFGVAVESPGARDSIRIDYDALGLGRVASRTIRFARNGREAGLSIASYGRVRRW